MKIINTIIGCVTVLFGCLLINITVYNDESKTLMYTVYGSLIGLAGIFYISRFGIGKKR